MNEHQHVCRACQSEPTLEHEMVHELMDALTNALVTTALRLKPEGNMDAGLAISALLSVTAHVINCLCRGGERRTLELQKCEAFFRDEYVQ